MGFALYNTKDLISLDSKEQNKDYIDLVTREPPLFCKEERYMPQVVTFLMFL